MSISVLPVTSDDVPRVWAHTRVTHGLLAAKRVWFGVDAYLQLACLSLKRLRLCGLVARATNEEERRSRHPKTVYLYRVRSCEIVRSQEQERKKNLSTRKAQDEIDRAFARGSPVHTWFLEVLGFVCC